MSIGWGVRRKESGEDSESGAGAGQSVGPGGDIAVETRSTSWMTASYPLSTLVIVAVIAFLMGSLLRSLISPADFIYVMPSIDGQEEVSSGWREIKRLVEVKYLVGGWDFQIAVVRRH